VLGELAGCDLEDLGTRALAIAVADDG